LNAAFYEYKYAVDFASETRIVSDPCTRYGGFRDRNAGLAVGGSRPQDNAVRPLPDGRRGWDLARARWRPVADASWRVYLCRRRWPLTERICLPSRRGAGAEWEMATHPEAGNFQPVALTTLLRADARARHLAV
jgi:hypothetical protein